MHAPQRPELRSVRGRPLLPFLPRVAGRGLRACRALLRRLSHRAVHRPSYCPSCLVPLSRCLLRTLLVALLRFRGTTILQRRQSLPRTVQVQLLLSTSEFCDSRMAVRLPPPPRGPSISHSIASFVDPRQYILLHASHHPFRYRRCFYSCPPSCYLSLPSRVLVS